MLNLNSELPRNRSVAAGIASFVLTALAGVTLHAQGVPGKKSLDEAYAMATANNAVYIGGHVIGSIPGQTGFGNDDGFLQTYNQNGKILWTAQFGTSAQDEVTGVAADSTGVYAAGYTEGAFPGQTYAGGSDAFITKYGVNGGPLWTKQFGGPGTDRIQAAASDGTYLYVTGYTSDALFGNVNVGGQDCFVQKWDQSGNLIWTTEFGTAGTDRAYGVTVNSTGIFVTGRTDGAFPGHVSAGGIDAFMAGFDFNGNFLWVNEFGTPADDRGWGITNDPTGIYVTGRTEGEFPGQTAYGNDDAFLVKFDFTGDQLWLTQFGTSRFDRGTAVSTDSTGVYAIGYTQGAFPGQTNAGSMDVYVEKYTSSGGLIWTVEFGSTQYDTAWGTATDSTGVYISGAAGGQLPNQRGAPAPTGYFLEKLDVNGNFLWVHEVSVPNGGGAN